MLKASDLRRKVAPRWRPPPKLTVSEWANHYRRLSPESSSEPGRYRSSRTPYIEAIMDALNDPAVKEVWWQKSSQVGATEALNNIAGYYIDQDPSTVIVMQPTVEMGQAWSKDRFAPMVRDTAPLRDKISVKTKDGTSTMLHKKFPGGHLTICGANSAASLASRPIRVVLCDEVDRYPASAGTEGDPVNLVKVRSTTFWNRKFFAASTPTISGASRIEKGYTSGDQRQFYVPCLSCGHKQPLKWEQLDFSGEGKPEEPLYRCEECGHLHRDHEKPQMLRGGEWVANADFKGVASFHINALYSPWKSWGSVVLDFLQAKRGGPEMLKTWKNTMMGETYEESGEVMDAEYLKARSDVTILDGDQARVPDSVLFATWGADVQGDRLEVHLVGWGAGEEAWSIDYQIINGSPSNPLTWQKLDKFLATEWKTGDGRVVDVPIGGIDTGDGNTQQHVMAWLRERQGRRRGPQPFKGSSQFNAPIWTAPRKARKADAGKILPWMIGVSQAKLVIYDRLKMEQPGPGYIHFPSHYDEHFFKGLTAEKLITRYSKGFPHKEWHLRSGARNEPLDTTVYAYAAMKILNPDWDAIAENMIKPEENEEKPRKIRKKPVRRPAKVRVRM